MKRFQPIARFYFVLVMLGSCILIQPIYPQNAAQVSLTHATGTPGEQISLDVKADLNFVQVASIDFSFDFDPTVLTVQSATSLLHDPVVNLDNEQGEIHSLQTIPAGVDITAGSPILTLVFKIQTNAPVGTISKVSILPEPDGQFEFYGPLPPIPPQSISYSFQTPGVVTVAGNHEPAIHITPDQAVLSVGTTSLFQVTATDPDKEILQLDISPPNFGSITQSMQVEDTLTAIFELTPTLKDIGEHTIRFTVFDTQVPPATATAELQVTVESTEIDEILVSQGFGGKTLVNVRNIDPQVSQPILRSFAGALGLFLERIGGGSGRALYMSSGDIDNDNSPEVILSMGPIVSDATFPNIIIPRNIQTRRVVGHSFVAFPTGDTLPVQYNRGEIRTAVGDFIGSGTPQIAAAQGWGGNGVIRLFQYSGLPAPRGFELVGQFNGLVSGAWTTNANGGMTLAAGDLDQDGVDELLVGQTNSDTSVTLCHVLDISNAGKVEHRSGFVAFPKKFQGNGGIELAVADLDGDGTLEIVAASQGNRRNFGDDRDQVPINLISVIQPTVVDNLITGFSRIPGGIRNTWSESINPSGAFSIAPVEIDGNPGNGTEFVIGTGALYQVNNFTITPVLPAPQSKFMMIKIDFDGSQVTGVSIPLGSVRGFNAFIGDADPSSGSIFVNGVNSD